MCQWSMPLWNQRSRWEIASLEPFAEWRVSCKAVCAAVPHRPPSCHVPGRMAESLLHECGQTVMEPCLHDLCGHMQGPRALWQNCPLHVSFLKVFCCFLNCDIFITALVLNFTQFNSSDVLCFYPMSFKMCLPLKWLDYGPVLRGVRNITI